MNKKEYHPIVGVLIGLAIVSGLIGLNWWLFNVLAGENYFIWYLTNASLISIVVSFIALIWDGLEMREDLLSTHPAIYVAGCFHLMAVLYLSLSVHLREPLVGTKDNETGLRFAVLIVWDSFMTILVALALLVLGFGWLLIIAPLNYFVTLITGALARRHFRGTRMRPIVVKEGKHITITAQPVEKEIPPNAIDVSLTKKPFAVTQAITSLFLFVIKMIFVSVS
jgi:hypothetical protein